MIKYEKITKRGTCTTNQSCLYLIGKRHVVPGNFGGSDFSIWSIQSAGVSLCANGQKEPGFNSISGTIRSFYSKIRDFPYQTRKDHGVIDGGFDQLGGKNGAGRVFIKTRPWRKKRDKLSYPVLMTGLVSKSSPRLIVSLSLILSFIIP